MQSTGILGRPADYSVPMSASAFGADVSISIRCRCQRQHSVPMSASAFGADVSISTNVSVSIRLGGKNANPLSAQRASVTREETLAVGLGPRAIEVGPVGLFVARYQFVVFGRLVKPQTPSQRDRC